MECRAEINRFAIFLFCLLAPLGSMAPTETSESKMTTGQRQNNFTPEIPTFAAVIQKKAHDLFKFYNKCVSAPYNPELWCASEGRAMADRIPECPAFQANCCALHHIRNALIALQGSIESICTNSARDLVETNLSQLNTTLSQGTAFYTCSSHEPPQDHNMGHADTKTYIWCVLKKYDDIMQFTRNLYSEAAV